MEMTFCEASGDTIADAAHKFISIFFSHSISLGFGWFFGFARKRFPVYTILRGQQLLFFALFHPEI